MTSYVEQVTPSTFALQALVTMAAMTFCIVMIATSNNEQIYLPIFTAMVGYWMPAPSRPASTPEAIHELPVGVVHSRRNSLYNNKMVRPTEDESIEV